MFAESRKSRVEKKERKSDGTQISRVYPVIREIHDFCMAENSPTPDNVARASISTPLTPYKRRQLTLIPRRKKNHRAAFRLYFLLETVLKYMKSFKIPKEEKEKEYFLK